MHSELQIYEKEEVAKYFMNEVRKNGSTPAGEGIFS